MVKMCSYKASCSPNLSCNKSINSRHIFKTFTEMPKTFIISYHMMQRKPLNLLNCKNVFYEISRSKNTSERFNAVNLYRLIH